MHPDLITIGTFTIHSYGVMVALAFAVGIMVSLWIGRKEGLKPEKILDAVLLVMVSSVLGARLFYIIEFRNNYASFIDITKIWEGGLVFYGGLIFAALALVWWSRRNGFSFLKILDIAAFPATLGYAIGRIGCFLNGCCYGIDGHPTQIYASLSGLTIFMILLALRKNKKFKGQLFSIGLILYSIYRFLNEFLRVNPKYILGMSEAQIISIIALIFGVILYAILYRREKEKPAA
ncbi:prolipoprotein diacylglyceryl transferase [Candidatus Margulisiibacteriota bacterium]